MHEGCFLQTRLSNTLNVSVDQKTQPSIRFKTCGWAFETLRRAFKTLDWAFETLDRAFEDLRETKSSSECLRSSVAGLCYNTAQAAPISHGKSRYKWRVLGYKTAALLLSVKFKWFIFWFKIKLIIINGVWKRQIKLSINNTFGSSLIYNTSARHKRHECDTSNTSATRATRVLHEWHECDTSEKFWFW